MEVVADIRVLVLGDKVMNREYVYDNQGLFLDFCAILLKYEFSDIFLVFYF